uniref:40S ribosomal protein S6 n=1 Tax=Macrostomum lignano TaxID=282301 RepID=A0A1I8JR67_9PLAT
INVSFPTAGSQKCFEVDDIKKLTPFFGKRMSAEVPADSLGEEWKGYVVRISGGNDKQGFPMKQGVLTNGRVPLLLSAGHSLPTSPPGQVERKRKSVRGAGIVDSNLSCAQPGPARSPASLTTTVPRRLGPKRGLQHPADVQLTKKDDVSGVRDPAEEEDKEGKPERTKAPKIQRLADAIVLQPQPIAWPLKRRRAHKETRKSAREYGQADFASEPRRPQGARRRRERKRSRSTLCDYNTRGSNTLKFPVVNFSRLFSTKCMTQFATTPRFSSQLNI